jgi:hypothetical protein
VPTRHCGIAGSGVNRYIPAMRALVALTWLVAGCGSSDHASNDLSATFDMGVPADMTKPLPPECDVVAGSGCASGQKCTVGTDHNLPRDLCFAIAASPVGEGAACMTVVSGDRSGDNCAAGLICEDFPGDGPHCRRPCFVRAQCSGGQACVLTTTTSTQKMSDAGILTLKACVPPNNCDPVAQNVCTGGRNCWLSPADDVGRVGLCLVNETMGMAGAACDPTHQVQCAPGFRCATLNFCRRYCYFDLPDGGAAGSGACPSAEGPCQRFFESGPVYGICGAQ